MQCLASCRCFMNPGCSQGRWSQIIISLAPQTFWAPPLAHSSSSEVSWLGSSVPSSGFFPESLPVQAKVLWLVSWCLLPHVFQLPSRGPGLLQTHAPPAPLQARLPVVRPAPALAMPHSEGSSLGKVCSPSLLHLMRKAGCRVVVRANVSSTMCSKSSGLGTPRDFLSSWGHCPSREPPPEMS